MAQNGDLTSRRHCAGSQPSVVYLVVPEVHPFKKLTSRRIYSPTAPGPSTAETIMVQRHFFKEALPFRSQNGPALTLLGSISATHLHAAFVGDFPDGRVDFGTLEGSLEHENPVMLNFTVHGYSGIVTCVLRDDASCLWITFKDGTSEWTEPLFCIPYVRHISPVEHS
ncbi:hypothetical protein MIND_01248200 [Mycena indigotica]|uniref:Uncharacterized protein n=1 Tax=Mycena indigotica TaxID=2126181 RepID=A0A8H6VXW5_9AGAR|nr:uncharacterized protein MIND_01248200 [Mycena indigotica]KAF7292209.1 hypothetical protein MIND_01248200 [Mycena indigotica]